MSVQDIERQLAEHREKIKRLELQLEQEKRNEVAQQYLKQYGLIVPEKRQHWYLSEPSLNILLAQSFGIRVDVKILEGWGRYTYHFVHVAHYNYTAASHERVQAWVSGSGNWPGIANILCDLEAQGRIPQGDYFINVVL